MPVHVIKDDKGHILAYKYGSTGKRYNISEWGKADAARRAYAQEAAIEHSQEREGKKPDPPMAKNKIEKTLINEGAAKNQPDDKYNPIELEIGKIVEKEHLNDTRGREEIAKDHLQENPWYYTEVLAPKMKDAKEATMQVLRKHGYSSIEEYEKDCKKKDPPKKDPKEEGVLSYDERKKMKKSSFAIPSEKTKSNPAGEGAYPIPDENHARNALARVDQYGTPEEKKLVREKVRKKFPGIEQSKPIRK